MSAASKTFRAWVERPMSVIADVVISTAFGIVLFLVLCMLFGIQFNVVLAVIAGLSGCLSGAVYMRARTNLIDPAPAFKG